MPSPGPAPYRKIRWWYTIPIVLAFGLLADYFVLHILFPIKQQAILDSSWNGMTESERDLFKKQSDTTNSVVQSQATNKPEARDAAYQSQLLQVLADCAPEVRAQGISTLEGLYTYAEKSIGVNSEIVDIENYNYRLRDGVERRLHIIPADDTNSSQNKELRYYKLDHEGYPERIPLSAKESLNPTPDFLANMMKDATIHLHQIKKRLDLKDGTRLSVNIVNQQIQELEFFGTEKTLQCNLQTCRCGN